MPNKSNTGRYFLFTD